MFASIFAGALGLLLALILGGVGLAVFVFWIWMLIHAITNDGLSGTEKILWVLLLIFLHFLGAILYFFIGRPKASTSLQR